jgi:hypothetical protein
MSYKRFKIAAVSSNTNSFGLTGYILIARDGTAFEVARSRGAWNTAWKNGDTKNIPLDENGNYAWSKLGVEIPRALPKAPKNVLKSIFKGIV